MDPFASLVIGQTKVEELRQQAALHRQAARARGDQGGRFRTFAGQALISLGERLVVRGHVVRSAR